MLFNSPVFLFLFLPLAFAWHWTTTKDLRNTVLLFLSLIFYWWGGSSVIHLLVASIVLNWIFGLLIGWNEKRALWLGIGVTLNLLLLSYYKYANGLIFPLIGLKSLVTPNAVIPLGISFYTFHSISYLVDVYRSAKKPFLNPIDFGLYICLFPQLVAGPIVRFHDIADQINDRRFRIDRMSSGCERFIFGLAKKVILADNLSPIADHVFSLSRGELSTSAAWIGLISFTLQIYYDFSGYSDMAIGLARLFGFELLENFNYPYFANSITDFWHRWHLSLSAWFRDYLYIPLGGNRVSPLKVYRNLMIVFLLCGLWHGANLNFLFWGVYNGAFLILERMIDIRRVFVGWLSHFYAVIVVMAGWVLFRTHSFHDATHFYSALIGVNASASSYANGLLFLLGGKFYLTLILSVILALPCFTFLATDFQERRFPSKATHRDKLPKLLFNAIVARPITMAACRACLSIALLILAVTQMVANTAHSFIYFNF